MEKVKLFGGQVRWTDSVTENIPPGHKIFDFVVG